jgi:hypothetical protein
MVMKFSRWSLLAIPAIAALALISNVGSAQLLLPEFCQVNTCGPPSVGVPYTFIDNLVCWDGAVLTKKTGSICPALSTEYHLDLGVYYPASGWITPLDVNGLPQADAFCCESGGDCYETASGLCPPSEIAFWCPEGEEPVVQNGELVCQ